MLKLCVFFYPHPRTFFIAFQRNRNVAVGEGGEWQREWETDIDVRVVAFSHTPQIEEWTCTLGMCPDYESNSWPLGSWADTLSSWATEARACDFSSHDFYLLDFRCSPALAQSPNCVWNVSTDVLFAFLVLRKQFASDVVSSWHKLFSNSLRFYLKFCLYAEFPKHFIE